MYDDLTNYPKPLNDVPEESFTLPNWMYTDPAVYELEKERIFYRTWQYVGHKTLFQKPGDYVTAQITITLKLFARHAPRGTKLPSCATKVP